MDFSRLLPASSDQVSPDIAIRPELRPPQAFYISAKLSAMYWFGIKVLGFRTIQSSFQRNLPIRFFHALLAQPPNQSGLTNCSMS
jgi:hypothetical protein